MPDRRSAPVKVVVFQCPCGTGARQRCPRLARPRSRAILVEAPVSSMKTKLSGSRSGCAWNQACRRATTSGRSCSLACAVFFNGHAVPIEEAPDRAGCETGTVVAPNHVRTSMYCSSPSSPVFTNLTIQATRPPRVKEQAPKYPSGDRTPKLVTFPLSRLANSDKPIPSCQIINTPQAPP
jgi:hypothetical protein